MIEKESDIETCDFHEEILSNGNVHFYKNGKNFVINCINKENKYPNKYNCLLLSGK